MKWGGGWCCRTDLDRQVVGSEGEVVPPDKTWMLCSHVHLQMLKKVNVLLLCICCVLREGRGQLATDNGSEDQGGTLSPDSSYTDMQCMAQACMPSQEHCVASVVILSIPISAQFYLA